MKKLNVLQLLIVAFTMIGLQSFPVYGINFIPSSQQEIPFVEGFESVNLPGYWTSGGTNTPAVSTTQVHSGSYALAFNTAHSNSSYVEVELASATDPTLSFSYFMENYYNKDLMVQSSNKPIYLTKNTIL